MGSWSRGSTRAWRATRRAVLLRDRATLDPATGRPWQCRAHDEGWCERKRPGPHTCDGTMVHAHHTRGRAVTGDDPMHIVGACAPCNQWIGDPAAGPADPVVVPITRW